MLLAIGRGSILIDCIVVSVLWLLFLTVAGSCREFGAKVVNVKQLLKAMPGMFEHNDKNVRAEVRLITYCVALYRITKNFRKTSRSSISRNLEGLACVTD